MAITYYASNRILDRYFGNTNFTPATNYYLGISTTAPQPDGTGITEPVGNGYARVLMANTKISFTDAVDGSVQNEIEFQFPEATGSWGVITHFFISDASSGGNIEIYGTLTNSRTVEIGTVLILEATAMQINLRECTL